MMLTIDSKYMVQENVLEVSDIEVGDDSEPEAAAAGEVDEVGEDLPSFLEAEEMVWKLKWAAPKLGIMEAGDVGHLDSFLRAMRRVKNSKKKKDTTMHAYFEKAPKKDRGRES